MLTIAPPPAAAIAGIVCLQHQTTALSATSMIESQASLSSSVTRRSARPGPMSSVGAALLTSVVTVPYRSSAAPTMATTSSSWARSVRTNTASPPAARISSSTAAPSSSLRPVTTTRAPSRAKRTAVARPIPRVDPVTIATFPASRSPDAISGA